MKKIVCLVLAVLMLVSLAACNRPAVGTESTKNPQKETQAPKPTETEPEATEAKPTEDQKKGTDLKIYGDIYVVYPEPWRTEENSRTNIFYQDETCLVGITSKKGSSFEGELEDIIPYLSEAFANDVSSYSKGLLAGQEIETASVERGTVAGFDCVKFTGKINNNDNWDCHVYGYAMIVEDRVLMITGLVSTEAQDAGMIAEINALTDQIAESVYVKG